MEIKLHANATTTPKVRAYIQSSRSSVAELARELGVSETSVRRWRKRKDVADRSHVRHNLGQSTSLVEEALICGLRRDARLGLDDICEVMNRCVNPKLSRSAIYRCLQRQGLSGRTAPQDPPAPAGRFAAEPFGFVHVDLKHLTRLDGVAAYIFVAVERATRFAHIEIVTARNGATIAACLERFLAAFGHPVHTILTDNGSEFTDRFGEARRLKRRHGTGRHPFDRVCAAHGIEHRLTRPFRPQTNGMVERFNRRLAEAIRAQPPTRRNEGKNRFETHARRNAFILGFVDAYNRTRLKCLAYKAPLEALNNLAEHNTKAG
jgi:transposase InsO family protein